MVGIIRDGEPRTSTSSFTQLVSAAAFQVQGHCSFTSTETVGIMRDGEPRTATSTFGFMSSEVHLPLQSKLYIFVSFEKYSAVSTPLRCIFKKRATSNTSHSIQKFNYLLQFHLWNSPSVSVRSPSTLYSSKTITIRI